MFHLLGEGIIFGLIGTYISHTSATHQQYPFSYLCVAERFSPAVQRQSPRFSDKTSFSEVFETSM